MRNVAFLLLAFIMISCQEAYVKDTALARSGQDLCEQRQIRLWNAAKSYCVERGVPVDKKIRVDDLSDYVREGRQGLFCPLSHLKYPDFSLYDGPKCPAGHELQADEVKNFRNQWLKDRGPKGVHENSVMENKVKKQE